MLHLQKKYKEEAEKTMSHYVPVLDTPEMQRVRENQKNFSTVSVSPRVHITKCFCFLFILCLVGCSLYTICCHWFLSFMYDVFVSQEFQKYKEKEDYTFTNYVISVTKISFIIP